ncbi:MAG: DNA mismatch repair endonuclease MutL [Candidatus Dependentiae bacterium]|nr:DNA mismatch repair endonuclease MutL [Candidatus Dependentiae bacterium]
MAQTIKILDPQEAIKIAAGEVIERPAHIIKELIENSVDAKASTITIHARSAGKDEISISDNGSGMSPDDAMLCFAHHATSKISTVHDLQNIVTYGFRGEALSSIASVSHVELITKTDEEKSATHLVLHEGKVITETVAARQTGTTLTITDLFASIPARKKFLKSDDTEWNLIVSIFQAFCLRYPNIHFKLFHNGHLSYNCPPTKSNIKDRCAQLWSGNLDQHLIDLEPKEEKTISVTGAISTPHYYRFNRGQIFTFVNNRWVKNIEITKGLIKGYDGVLPAQKYPAAFLFITIDPAQVDINVHPKKEEVKFLHPGIVQRVIQEAVQKTLSNFVSSSLAPVSKAFDVAPQTFYKPYQFFTQTEEFSSAFENKILGPRVKPEDEEREDNASSFARLDIAKDNVFSSPFRDMKTDRLLMLDPRDKLKDDVEFTPNVSSEFSYAPSVIPAQAGIQEEIIQTIPISAPEVNKSIYEQEPYSIVGQFKKTYIMLEKNNQLILIDQHAAHERILYEQFKKNINETATVRLLFPHIIKLSASEIEQITAYEKLFYKHGIEFEAFSQTELIIQATPVQMQAQAVQEIIHLALAWITQNHSIDHDELFTKLHEKILAEKSCKAACKAGDSLNHEQMDNVIKELLKTENRFCCPHGRPTVWGMDLKEIEKHFKRDYVGSKQSSGYLIF